MICFRRKNIKITHLKVKLYQGTNIVMLFLTDSMEWHGRQTEDSTMVHIITAKIIYIEEQTIVGHILVSMGIISV
nr:MAG TPA: hypothetical protein [Bacteriophage sp.]